MMERITKLLTIMMVAVFLVTISIFTTTGFATEEPAVEIPENFTKVSMPDFGQHSSNWCWVASLSNSMYWYKHFGGFSGLYPAGWEMVDPDSTNPAADLKDNDGDGAIDEDPYNGIDDDLDGMIDEDGNDWYDDMDDWGPLGYYPGIDNDLDGAIDEDPVDGIDNDLDGAIDEDPAKFQPNPGYWTLLKKVAESTWRDSNMNGVKDPGESNYVYSQPVWKWDYLLGIENILNHPEVDRRGSEPLIVHDIKDPSFTEFPAGPNHTDVIAGGVGGRDRIDDPGRGAINETNKHILEEKGIEIELRTPTFEDYKRELSRSQDVILWIRRIDTPVGIDHVVTGVSYDSGVVPPTIGYSDPWTHAAVPPHDDNCALPPNLPDHNKAPGHDPSPYEIGTVINENPLQFVAPDGKVWQVIDMIFISPEPEKVPTMLPAGLMALAGLLSVVAAMSMRKRKQ